MQTTALQLCLALAFLAQGPLCGLLCDVSPLPSEVRIAGHLGANGVSPCHGSPEHTTPTGPESSHDDCSACGSLLLTVGETPTSGTGIGNASSSTAMHAASYRVASLGRGLRIAPSGHRSLPDILILKSTLLL